MTVRGLTKKQVIILLEKMVHDDNVCITEGDMVMLFDNYGDVFEASCERGEIFLSMTHENSYWKNIRDFIWKLGDKLKGYKYV